MFCAEHIEIRNACITILLKKAAQGLLKKNQYQGNVFN